VAVFSLLMPYGNAILAVFTSHRLPRCRLLKRQTFGPAQIFDEINRRLDPGQQRKLVLSLGIPVQARLFAHANALETAGVEPMMVPA
jgi:hypothetical protein